ncbi:hypothetical protein O1611_g568 [Lasiodiplodia mahajangana]|uniref:Uncharacterized protein n=1 Tax=Lasiodiplodia mahajangana TaxID=1108764 RepID=A0ACC2K0J3_9PEZI|nr:hypothetical protein O1611_g568 [Lasiodiplodia mahajangana]
MTLLTLLSSLAFAPVHNAKSGSQSMLQAREDGCATARELFDTWDETDDQSIEYLRERRIPFEMTEIVVAFGYRKPNKHDICRLQVRGPHLISVDGKPPKGDYGVCIEDEYGVAASRGKTVKANIDPRSLDLSLPDQPKTIRDAIKVTRRLHFDYLWIDSLCIIQDDPEDVARELSSKTSAEGMLNPVLNLPANVSCGYRCPDGQVGKILLQKAGYTPGSLGVHGRCWTLQEHLLPSRILAYAGSGLRWSCRTTTLFDGPWTTSTVFINYLEKIETYRSMSAILSNDLPCGVPTIINNQGMPLQVDDLLVADLLRPCQKSRSGLQSVSTHEPDIPQGTGTVSKLSAISQWRKLLQEFTSRSITNPADRLPAISAAARKFHNVLAGRYIAGLWEIALPLELLWAPQGGSQKGRDQGGSFPSWSWASSRHRVEWHIPPSGVATLQCLETQLDFLYPSVPYGHVTRGRLRVRGDLMPVRCEAVDAAIHPSEWKIDRDLPMIVHNSAFLVPRLASDDATYEAYRPKILAILDEKMEIGDLREIYCLEVIRRDLAIPRTAGWPSVGLVLTPADDSGTSFWRIGVFGMLHGRTAGLRTHGDSMVGDMELEIFWEKKEVLLM